MKVIQSAATATGFEEGGIASQNLNVFVQAIDEATEAGELRSANSANTPTPSRTLLPQQPYESNGFLTWIRNAAASTIVAVQLSVGSAALPTSISRPQSLVRSNESVHTSSGTSSTELFTWNIRRNGSAVDDTLDQRMLQSQDDPQHYQTDYQTFLRKTMQSLVLDPVEDGHVHPAQSIIAQTSSEFPNLAVIWLEQA